MDRRFSIDTVVENGHPHYKITDYKTGNVFHCDFGELTEVMNEMIGE